MVKPELAPFDLPPPKTPSSNQTRSKSDDRGRDLGTISLPRSSRYRHFNFLRCRLRGHLKFGENGNSDIRSAYVENLMVSVELFSDDPCYHGNEKREFYQKNICYNHRLNGSSSPVLTATCLSNGSFYDFLTFFSGTRLGVRRPDRSSRKMAQMTWIRA